MLKRESSKSTRIARISLCSLNVGFIYKELVTSVPSIPLERGVILRSKREAWVEFRQSRLALPISGGQFGIFHASRLLRNILLKLRFGKAELPLAFRLCRSEAFCFAKALPLIIRIDARRLLNSASTKLKRPFSKAEEAQRSWIWLRQTQNWEKTEMLCLFTRSVCSANSFAEGALCQFRLYRSEAFCFAKALPFRLCRSEALKVHFC